MPPSFHPETLLTAQGAKPSDGLFPSRRPFKQYGQSGLWVSDWLPNIAQHVDDIAVIRSCQSDAVNHVGGVCEMNTGSILAGRPSLGAWLTYGLGSAQRNLPTFVVMQDDKEILGGVQNYGSGFLPATYQGTLFRQGDTPILNLKPPAGTTDEQQRSKIDLLQKLNELYGRNKQDDTELDARTRSYELAYQMQSSAPEAVDLSSESEATKKLYGMDETETAVYGANCLMARRLVERGVRFVEVYSGSGSGWDAHQDVNNNHTKWCKASDKPVAGLLADLKARGMLKDTLVVWGGEFGRTPFAQYRQARLRRSTAAITIPGASPCGWRAAASRAARPSAPPTRSACARWTNRITCGIIHASILYLLGLDHLKTTYMHNGRAERPTVTGGNLIQKLWA